MKIEQDPTGRTVSNPKVFRSNPIRAFGALAVLVGLAFSLFLPLKGIRNDDFSASGFAGPGYVPQEQTAATADLSGSLNGLAVEETGEPISGIHVELIPADKTGDQRWYRTISEWTDASGEYRFQHVEPGTYIISVAREDAPSANHPFVGAYLPGVQEESEAERIRVEPAARIGLRLVRLRRVETVKLTVKVEFADGTRPHWTNLLFHNRSFPRQAVIGDEAPGLSEGEGQFTAPVGFEYLARAVVSCDAGDHIETRESRPDQRIRVTSFDLPKELTFVIPGSACPLWAPKP